MTDDNNNINRVDIGVIAAELLEFYDKFVDFHDYCAFLCDSFSCLANKDEPVETNTAKGVILFTDWMKYRAQLLKIELNDIRRELHKVSTAAKLRPIK